MITISHKLIWTTNEAQQSGWSFLLLFFKRFCCEAVAPGAQLCKPFQGGIGVGGACVLCFCLSHCSCLSCRAFGFLSFSFGLRKVCVGTKQLCKAQSIKCLQGIILHQASSAGSKTKKRTENDCFVLSLLSSPIPVLPFSQLAHIFPAGWRCFRSVRPSPIVEDNSSFCLTFQRCWGVSNVLIFNDWVRRRTFQGVNGTHWR